MPEPPTPDFIQQQLRQLRQAIAERAASEDRLRREYGGGLGNLDAQHQRTLASIAEKYDAEEANARQTHDDVRDAALKRFETHFQAIQKDYQTQKRSNRQWYETERERLEREADDAGWMINSVLDTQSSDGPYRELKTFRGTVDAERKQLREQLGRADADYREVVEVMTARRQWRDFHEPVNDPPAETRETAREEFDAAYESTTRAIRALKTDPLSRLVAGWGFLILLVLVYGLFFGTLMILDPRALPLNVPQDTAGWMLTAAAVALLPTVVIGLGLFTLNRGRVGQMMRRLQTSSVRARRAHQRWRDLVSRELEERQEEYKRWHTSVSTDRKQALERIRSVSTERLAGCEARKVTTEEETERSFTERLEQISEMRDVEIAAAEEQLQNALQHLQQSREKALAGVTDGYERMRKQHVEEVTREFAEVESRWTAALDAFQTTIDKFKDRCDDQTVLWQDRDDAEWELPAAVPDSLRFGRLTCELRDLPNGLPDDDRLRPKRDSFELPAALSFPQCGSMLFRAKGDGLNKAVNAMRAVMLRLLTSLPPGKIRFTVIDPAGMGEAFAGFMHLTDYDPLMIGNRIWTESGQIEKRLAELSEHMENIFQAYLRNEFATIDEYNKHAHEVAEPYHVLVVASFPTNFTESAARRLANIAASGSRCGVYTLISIDEGQKPPHDFDFSKLETDARVLQWKKDRFALLGDETSKLPLTLDEPPPADDFGRIVRAAGAKHQNARKVEVPFERIAPRPDEIWAKDSRSGIDVPLGRAGATKLQYLRLGRGTSQHVLVAGKTGAGKSSFLHAFITNLALHYGPDEVEFYLVDFKKGVEFKTYAANALPHARVIGIESDREFGVSVLERLDGILKERGELFRQHGVQDIEAYRNANTHGARPVGLGSHPAGLPRIMLVVDEFQEFFVEDDNLSQTASLLLDRLVRQGRAFGIHVLLGSQTLGGAYSLARSTLGQVAVRIALQCSESDAHLILSEENTAARLLTRPGEAIYNDANGLVEGNHPFQVAWLPDKQRESSLRQLQRRVEREPGEFPPPIVFEGNIASDARRNRDVVKLFEEFQSAERPLSKSPTVWLGEAVSITEPTRIRFQRRPGDNLLVVGRNAKDAHGLLAVSFLTLAAQLPEPSSGSLYVLDGESIADDDGPNWESLIAAAPHNIFHTGSAKAADAVADVSQIVKQRIGAGDSKSPPVFLLIADLSRFRDLRNESDGYGFPGFESDVPPNPGAMLAEILRDGPAVGVHTIVWCDNGTNLTRWFGHAGLREFEMRVAFQMNSADSSNLIDTPAAARLGPHRALLYRGETGGCEKFRPYAAPDDDWLATIADHMHGREREIGTWDDVGLLTVT